MNEITADTPFDEVSGKRKSAIILMQKVLDCTDPDFMRAMTQFRKTPELGAVIDATRAGAFDYRKLLVSTDRGAAWPPASATLKCIELAASGELTEDSKPWKDVVKSLNLDGEGTAIDGTKVTAETLFALVTGEDSEVEKPAPKKRKAPAKRKSAPRKKVGGKEEEAPADKSDSSEEQTSPANSDAILTALGEGLTILDERLTARIDAVGDDQIDRVNALRGDIGDAFAGVFQALSTIAQMQRIVYQRQEELDMLIDPHAEFPEVSDELAAAVEELANYGDAVESKTEDEATAEDDGEVEEQQDDEKAEEEVEEQQDDEDGDVATLELSRDLKTKSDDDFIAYVDQFDDILIPKFPEGKSIMMALSLGKVQYLAEKVGVPDARAKNHKVLLIGAIGKLLGLT